MSYYDCPSCHLMLCKCGAAYASWTREEKFKLAAELTGIHLNELNELADDFNDFKQRYGIEE